MMNHPALAIALSISLATPLAFGQDEPTTDDTEDLFDETSTEGTMGSPEGAEENPDDPDALTIPKKEEGDQKEEAKAEPEQGPYPQRQIDRPITLYRNMAEIRLDTPFVIDNLAGSGSDSSLTGITLAVQGRFGVTDKAEVGLRWGAVAFHEKIGTPPSDSSVTSGRAVQLDAVYQIFGWLGAQVSLPFYLDPFAMGLTLGVPLQGEIGPIRFYGLRDLVQIKLVKFAPIPNAVIYNDAQIDLDELNTTLPDGRLAFSFGAIYQHSDAFSIMAESGWILEDFKNRDAAVPLKVGPLYSPNNKIDVGLLTGFTRMDETDSFFLSLLAALRI